ncbi:MAG TPA: 30S ribosomal protein S27e [Methanocorpusculum sp.]|nr:30S ribosomal protein S27e [Methanocorpusculum sp.]HJJ54068.1 30S ribosomal protein S27e [Methanocorpusculum sp.]
MVKASRENRSKFLKVKCPDCENEQLVFEKATSVVECTVCGRVLAEPTGGKAVIKADIVATFE